jgi:MFS family permease
MRITTTQAATLFTPFGIVQVAGSVLTGYFASKINDKMCFVLCGGCGAVLMGALALCRTYTSFAVVLGLLGFPSAGAFAVVPPLVAKTFPGPNVGLLIGGVFAASSIGGFTAATVISAIQHSSNHDYTTAAALVGVFWAIGGLILQFGFRSC